MPSQSILAYNWACPTFEFLNPNAIRVFWTVHDWGLITFELLNERDSHVVQGTKPTLQEPRRSLRGAGPIHNRARTSQDWVSHEAECGSAGEIFRFGFPGKVEGQDLRRLALLQQERRGRGFSVSRVRYRTSSIRRCRGPSNHRDDCCNHSDQVRTGKTLQLSVGSPEAWHARSFET